MAEIDVANYFVFTLSIKENFMANLNRRNWMKGSVALAAGTFGLPLSARSQPEDRLKILVTGGHPDDPETGCGGMITAMAAAGHEVTVLYLTRGEAGIGGKRHEEAAAIRTEEAKTACELMGATPRFFGQTDGATFLDATQYAKMETVLREEKPDLLFTHWPIDHHRDHRVCSSLTFDAWLRLEEKPALYYYEVVFGYQTQAFSPTDYFDITEVRETKHQASFAHRSQGIEAVYMGDHGLMETFRGREAGVDYAEAFVRHPQGPQQLNG